MIPFKEVEFIHDILIESFGGTPGIRDRDLLNSALSRPFQTFDNSALCLTAIAKAAALIESLVNNHPFVDGNKRTGYVLMRLLLYKNGFQLVATKRKNMILLWQLLLEVCGLREL
jgi:death-on-curing protein